MPSTNLKKRIGFLCSGNGAIFRKVCVAVNRRWLRSDLVICIVNRPCPSEAIAESFGIPIVRVHRDRFRDRLAFSNEILEHLQHYEVDVVGLTFDSLLAGPILERYRWRMINVHPGLLPAFPGLSAVRKTREAGVLYGGGTIHFLDEKMDRGPIISQGIAAIRPGEDLAVYDKAAFDCCWRQRPNPLGALRGSRPRRSGPLPQAVRTLRRPDGACFLKGRSVCAEGGFTYLIERQNVPFLPTVRAF